MTTDMVPSLPQQQQSSKNSTPLLTPIKTPLRNTHNKRASSGSAQHSCCSSDTHGSSQHIANAHHAIRQNGRRRSSDASTSNTSLTSTQSTAANMVLAAISASLPRTSSWTDLAKDHLSARKRPSCLHCYHPHACFVFAMRGFVRGALTALAGKLTVGLVTALASGRILKSSLKSTIVNIVSARDTATLMRFLSVMSGSSRVATCLLTRWKYRRSATTAASRRSTHAHASSNKASNNNNNNNDSDDTPLYFSGARDISTGTAVLANFISGFAILLDNRDRRLTVALYLLVRALHELWRTLEHHKRVKTPTYASAVVFALTQCPILYAVTYCPASLPPAYGKWIAGMSNYSSEALRIVGNTKIFVPCNPLCHSGSCITYNLKDWVHGFAVRAMPMYLPVFFLPPILFNTRYVIANPQVSALRALSNCIRSCAFLATYTTQGKALNCLWRHLFRRNIPFTVIASGLGTALGLLFLPLRRHTELALYTLPRGIQTCMNIVRLWFPRLTRIGDSVPMVSAFVFALATALMRYCCIHGPGLQSFNALAYRTVYGVPAHTRFMMKERRRQEQIADARAVQRFRQVVGRWLQFDFKPSRPPSPDPRFFDSPLRPCDVADTAAATKKAVALDGDVLILSNTRTSMKKVV